MSDPKRAVIDLPEVIEEVDVEFDTKPIVCSSCGKELAIGDYPYCPHESTFRQNALHFDPILVYELPNGEHYYPGRNDGSQAPEGGKPIYLTTIQQADRFVNNVNAKMQGELNLRIEANRVHREMLVKKNREELYAALDRKGISRKAADEIIKDRDERREKANFARTQRPDFQIEVFSKDASNREAWADQDTNWRPRRA